MTFKKWLTDSSKVILFDGAMGTQLMQHGIKPGQIPDLLNITAPQTVTRIHSAYYQAGADMVQTCTFSSNLVNLEKHELSDKIAEINSKALENIKAAQLEGKLIVGDIGPSGEFRPPVGKATGEQWKLGFKLQIDVLESGVDLWHIETMSDLQEMVAAIDAIREGSQKPIIASMTYRKTKNKGFFTIMGDSLELCVNTLEEKNVDVIGTNCTLGSNHMIELAKDLVEISNKPISIKPNAGQPRLNGGTTVYDQSVSEFTTDIRDMIDLGVKIVGGCCGTTPAHIQQLRELINNRM